ncbi:MAG TPA: acetate uptake transporter [Acidimicrobiales bacterium]|nr:acetate uptake transporter [Acidimicrobiales bacterium]
MATTFGETRPATQPVEITAAPGVADPAPLGLAGFALTTFLLSVANAGWTRGTGSEWLGYALAYGGVAQLLAGMWEFRNRNVFGATAFSTYGGFWIGLALYVLLIVPHAKDPAQIANDQAWIILAFLIFNSYMLLWSLFVNLAVFGVFLTLEVTEILLVVGNFSHSHSAATVIKAAGIAGVVTAGVAWYTSAAGVVNGIAGRHVLFVGKPLNLAPRR